MLLAFVYYKNPKENGQDVSILNRISKSLKNEKVENKKSSDNKSKNNANEDTSKNNSGQNQDQSSNENAEDSNIPPEPESEPESLSAFVAFYSDNQSDSNEDDARHQAVVDRILTSGANPVFHAGDLMEDGTQNSLDRFNAVAATMLATRSFYGALGNNDREVGDPNTPSHLYLNQFGFSQYYSVNTGNLHLVVLDSAFLGASPAQLAWLDSDLKSAASQSRITGVMFHHPSFVSTINSYLINNNADFVVNGHTHVYAQYKSGGIYYFTLPGGTSIGYALANIYSTYGQMYIYNNSGGLLGNATFKNR